ncbi:sugar ABC transporter permease [Oceanobacillus sojae]|nr:sugar ABC transporter permease [Oceanobacillus sojae]MCT1905246.1 sugar ABC transporter permease [Oceanobacillus sojae]
MPKDSKTAKRSVNGLSILSLRRLLKSMVAKGSKYFFVIPALLFMIILVGYPLVYNIVLGFQDITMLNINGGDKNFIGFDNYIALFHDEVFIISLKNTVIFTIASIVFQFIFGFLFALFFNLKFRLASLLRGLMMVGWLIPITITALLFKFLMDSNVGLINYLLIASGFINEPIPWLSDPDVALWSVIITNIWIGIPFNMLLLSTGLSSLPKDVYESASLDGANKIQQFIHITIPLLRPVILIIMMLGFIYTFKVFDLVYVMTGGGPVNTTELLSILAYRYSFGQIEFSMGAAAANILLLFLFIVSLFYLRAIRKDEVI